MTLLQRECVCGRRIVAGAPWRIMEAVQAHNDTLEHRRWRRRREVALATAFRRDRMRVDLELVRLRRWAARQEVAA